MKLAREKAIKQELANLVTLVTRTLQLRAIFYRRTENNLAGENTLQKQKSPSFKQVSYFGPFF